MRTVLAVSIGIFALAACGRTIPPATGSGAGDARVQLAIRNVRIVNLETGDASAPTAIGITDGRIRHIGVMTADSVLDLGGRYVVPGLIDAHVHLAIGGTPAANALATLRAGFTTVVDLGAFSHRLLRIVDSMNAGHIPGPRVIAAGLWVGRKGGTCEFNGLGIEGGAEQFRNRVLENTTAGAGVIKVCLSSWPAASRGNVPVELTAEQLRAAVGAAHGLGRLVVAHGISASAVSLALDERVDGLAHAAFVDGALASRMASARMFMIPTLASLTRGDTSAVATELVNAVRTARRAGVPLVFGTDGGVLPHGAKVREFESLAAAGLTPLQALRAATVDAARALRLGDTVGTIRVGAAADIVAFDENPARNGAALGAPRFVLSRGRIVVAQP